MVGSERGLGVAEADDGGSSNWPRARGPTNDPASASAQTRRFHGTNMTATPIGGRLAYGTTGEVWAGCSRSKEGNRKRLFLPLGPKRCSRGTWGFGDIW